MADELTTKMADGGVATMEKRDTEAPQGGTGTGVGGAPC